MKSFCSVTTTIFLFLFGNFIAIYVSSQEVKDKGAVFRALMENADAVYFAKPLEDDEDQEEITTIEQMTRLEKEHLVLSMLMQQVDMDPTLIDQRPLPYNWMEELHQKTIELSPTKAFWKVFVKPPSQEEFDEIINLDTYAQDQSNSLHDLRRMAFSPHRDRGMVPALSVSFSSEILQPLQHFAGYATPSTQILKKLKAYGPIVEVGAGNGYWSAALQLEGVDVVAYDSEPPRLTEGADEKQEEGDTNDNNPNLFSHVAVPFTSVHQSTCMDLFEGTSSTIAQERTMLIVWPNNPDHLDNPDHFHGTDETIGLSIWDLDCLEAYLKAGGSTVIYVGEREDPIDVRKGFPPDVGMSSSKNFQQRLKERFLMVEQFDILKWWGADDVTVWKRKDDDEIISSEL